MIIIGCAIGIFDENAMWLAVFGDVGVCLIAIANSLRALRVGKIKINKANKSKAPLRNRNGALLFNSYCFSRNHIFALNCYYPYTQNISVRQCGLFHFLQNRYLQNIQHRLKVHPR